MGLDQFMSSGTALVEIKLLIYILSKIAVLILSVRIRPMLISSSKVIPLEFRMMECFLQMGFMNKEI